MARKNKDTGVYKIECDITGDFYIGSSVDIKKRWERHKKDLRRGSHHSIILQRAVDKYELVNFTFSVLELCSEPELLTREQDYFDRLAPVYNISLRAGKPPKKEYTAEDRARFSASSWNKGKKLGPRSQETKNKISKATKGIKKISPEAVEKLRQINIKRHKDNPMSAEARKHLSDVKKAWWKKAKEEKLQVGRENQSTPPIDKND